MTLVVLQDEADPRVIARVPQGEARREATLRDLIHDHPQILPVHELDPSFGRLFTVARELAVPGVGYIDVLLADARGRLVVVECKLWRNPQARREVVGQILDYARELARYGYEDLQRQISIATKRQGNVLHALALAAGTDLDEAAFVDRVSRDLAAGRFLLLVAGDGIAEGTRRIGEYLRDQPGLAFDFGLIEIAEYRVADADGVERLILQPRILAQTTLIERHVIRSEVAGIVLDPVTADPERPRRVRVESDGAVGGGGDGAGADASRAWSAFVARLVEELRFDDPAQPPPRRGGQGWTRIPLPGGFYANAWRSVAARRIGVQLRLPGPEGQAAYGELLAERADIDREFASAGLPAPDWLDEEVPVIVLREAAPAPWGDAEEAAQRAWLAKAANQFVNSFRPRLQRLAATAGGG